MAKEQSKDERENLYKNALKETEEERIEENQHQHEEQIDIAVPKTEYVGPEPGSLGKVKNEFEKKQELHEQNRAELSGIGWRKINTENLPSQGKFNDPTMRVKIKAASVEEIKHYSGLDETDLIDISDHINEIISKCCRIEYETRVGTWHDLKEADKYYVLMSIRDLTMDSNQKYNKLWQRTQCPKCGKKSENEITSHAFSAYTIPKNIIKHYDELSRKIVINDETFDEPLIISPPSVGLTLALQKHMQEHARKQQQAGSAIYFDAQFMLRLQYLLDSQSQVNEGFLKQLQKKMAEWPHEKLMAFEYVRDNMDVGVRPQLELVCRDTKAMDGNDEVGCTDDFSFTAPVSFRHGWRSVLDISGVIGRLFDSDSE